LDHSKHKVGGQSRHKVSCPVLTLPIAGYLETKKKTVKANLTVRHWVVLTGTTMQFFASEADAAPSAEVRVANYQ
jgi:hypothetical protein